MLVADAAKLYLKKIAANPSLKPRSKGYRVMLVEFMRRSSPTLFAMDARKTTERDCEEWLYRYQRKYAPSVVNNSIGTLRAIFDEAVRAGSRFEQLLQNCHHASSSAVSLRKSGRRARGNRSIVRISFAFLLIAACVLVKRSTSRGAMSISSAESCVCGGIPRPEPRMARHDLCR
jgi:hypothetical protein